MVSGVLVDFCPSLQRLKANDEGGKVWMKGMKGDGINRTLREIGPNAKMSSIYDKIIHYTHNKIIHVK